MCCENILEEIYYGNINPSVKCFDGDSKYAAFVGIISDNEEKLTAFLNGLPDAKQERQLFSQLMNAQSEVSAFGELRHFMEGFRLGARFMLGKARRTEPMRPWLPILAGACVIIGWRRHRYAALIFLGAHPNLRARGRGVFASRIFLCGTATSRRRGGPHGKRR